MDIGEITGATISTVAELLDLQDTLYDLRASNRPMSWAFRGQPRDFGTLIPSFQRQFLRQSFGAAELIERRLIAAFREHYAKLGDRNADMPSLNSIAEGFDLRCLSVMQHYEIPTRLLDWTSNMWTAVYFACASDPGLTAELWYYDRSLFDKQSAQDPSLQGLLYTTDVPRREPRILDRRGDNLIVEMDPRITPRMRQQLAHHTVSTNAFADHAPLLFELYQAVPPD